MRPLFVLISGLKGLIAIAKNLILAGVKSLTGLFGERKKKKPSISSTKGGKGEGSSSTDLESSFEVHDLVFHGLESMRLESVIPLADTKRELLSRKAVGNEAYKARKFTDAVEQYTSAIAYNIESRPFAAICFCDRAATYRALGQITDAIADCSLAISLDPSYLKAVSRRASLYEMIRDYGQAAIDLRKSVSILTSQMEEKGILSGVSDISSGMNELRQTQLRLYNIEEESRKGIPLNMYLILGVESTAAASEVKKAYRKAALKHHPDKAALSVSRCDNGDDGVWKEIAENVHKDADRLFKMIGEAYAVLSNPSKRSDYDMDEDMRNEVNKFTRSSSGRMVADVQSPVFERSGSRQWQDSLDHLLIHNLNHISRIDVIDDALDREFQDFMETDIGEEEIANLGSGEISDETLFAEVMALSLDESPPEDETFEEVVADGSSRVPNSVDVPPTDLELKPLPDHLEYAYLSGESSLPVVISSSLSSDEKDRLMSVLRAHKRAFAWKTTDIPGISPNFCQHKIDFLDDVKPVVQRQRRLNPNMKEVVKKEVIKLLNAGIIFPIADSPWVSHVHCVPKRGGMTIIENDNKELLATRTITGWRVCIDYRKLNDVTRKDHFPLPFIDQMLERLAGNKYFCFLDGFSGYFQIPIDPKDQEKTTFTCPFGTFAYRRMPFGLCNAPGTFQRCMIAFFRTCLKLPWKFSWMIFLFLGILFMLA